MSSGFMPSSIQQAQGRVSQMLTLVQNQQGTPCSAPKDAANPTISVVIASPPPGTMGGTTSTILETKSGDVFQHDTSSALNGDKWISFGKAPELFY